MRTVNDTVAGTKPPASACTRAFAGRPESVREARSWVAGFFPDPATAADAALMTSELVTNAIKYTACCLPGGQVLVSVQAGETGARVDIVDEGPVYPCFPVPGGLGLGLVLVRQLRRRVRLRRRRQVVRPERWQCPVSGRDIRVRLDRYASDVLALPEGEQLADLTVFQMAIEVGRQMERADLGIVPRPRPSRRSMARHLAVVRQVTS